MAFLVQRGTAMRAIVVSDNPLFQELMWECTRNLDIEIVLHNPEAGALTVASESPDIVILDDTCPCPMSEHLLAGLCRLSTCRIFLVNFQKNDVVILCSHQSLITSSVDLGTAIFASEDKPSLP